MTIEPLHVVAQVPSQVSLPGGWLALDALLMAAAALRDDLPPASVHGTRPIEIPLAMEPERRFHLTSWARARLTSHDKRFVNRRPVVAEAQALAGPKFRRISLSTGPNKGYRVPMEVGFLDGGRLEWWCIGERKTIEDLLTLVDAVGKKRSVGLGRVRRWIVEPCKPWDDGFPLVHAGRPTRPLPMDWIGLAPGHEVGYAVLAPPYYERHREEVLAMPSSD